MLTIFLKKFSKNPQEASMHEWKLSFYSADGKYLNEVHTVKIQTMSLDSFESVHEYVKILWPDMTTRYFYTIEELT